MIQITEKARLRLLGLLDKNYKKAVLLSVSSKGCGGHTYQMEFTESNQSDDVISLDESHVLVIDRKSLLWLFGVQMDFIDDGLDSHFEFINPAETGRCGCGNSFKVA